VIARYVISSYHPKMSNPWLTIPLTDYEGHMRSAAVQQLDVLSDLFAEAVTACSPTSVAILGIAGGNGLDRIDGSVTRRIVGIDVNQLYLDAVRQRYSHLLPLELHCIDLEEQVVELEPVRLVHAALVLEHAGTGRCLNNAVSLVGGDGSLSVVLQLPSALEQNVGSSGYSSILSLSAHFSLVDPGWLVESLKGHGFRLDCEVHRAVSSGKKFWMGIFGRKLSKELPSVRKL
jgi:hypothetical protein